MKIGSFLITSAAATFAFAVPALAQSTSTTTGADGDHSPTLSATGNTLTSTSSESKTSTETKTIASNDTATFTKLNHSYNTTNLTKAIDSYNTDNSQRNGNWKVVAVQELSSTTSNASGLEFNGDGTNYSSGNNGISGSSFAAYAGILNQGWNTGISSNAQAATNIAAQGTVTF